MTQEQMPDVSPQDDETQTVDLSQISPELRQVLEFEEVVEEAIPMVISIHEVSEPSVREIFDEMPASAQNVLDNFEQFHALVSVGQTFAAIDFMQEFDTIEQTKSMSDEEREAYRNELLDKILYNCVKDMVKQLKKARRDPILKKDFMEVFAK